LNHRASKSHLAGLFICLVIVLAWFSPWWVSGKNLAPLDILHEMLQPWRGTDEKIVVKNHFVADAVDQYLVYRQVAAQSYRQEGWVGWSSMTYGGTAQYANTMALYYDWTMQLHRWFDFWTAWHLGLMAQVALAATGMLFFLRGRFIGPLWSVCGALIYAANSQFVVWIYHRWTLSSFCWVPWILWSIDSYRKGKRCFWILVPIFIGLAMLGGTLQHGVFVVLVVMASWLEENLIRNPQSLERTLRIHILARYAAWGILGTGLAAMMILPCSDAFFTSNRLGLHTGTFGNSQNGIYPQGWLQPLFNLASYPFQIFPSILGRSETLDVMKLFKSELFYIAYFGSLPVLIAFLACFRKQVPQLARILIIAGLLLPLTPIVRLLYQRLFILFILGGILAFAHFMETASRETRLSILKITASITAFSIVLWGVLSIGFYVKSQAITDLMESKLLDSSSGSAFGYFRGWMEGRFSKFSVDLCIWSPHQFYPLILFLLALTGLWLSASFNSHRRKAGAWLVAVAVVTEVSLFASRWITYTDPVKFPLYPVTQEVTAIRENIGRGRTTTLNKETSGHMAITPFIPNTLSAYNIPTILGYDSIVPDGMALGVMNSSDANALGLIGVTHLITYPGNRPYGNGWNKKWESPSMVLFENQKAIPQYIGFNSDVDMGAFFKFSDSTKLIPLKEASQKENTRLVHIPVGVEWIRIAENHAQGWEYRVGNHLPPLWLPVNRAKDASMILKIGETEAQSPSVVHLRFNPPLRKTGMMISASAFLLTIAGGFSVIRARRQ
jgi:hypothetical protein